MAATKDEWDRIHYPELTDAENDEIRRARRQGFAAFWPTFPDAESQCRNTLAGARKFLAEKGTANAH
jgi:hypothetical protein